MWSATMTAKPIPDQGVLQTGDAFRVAAQELGAHTDSSMSVPAIVNAAFALELFLKSLNVAWNLADFDQIQHDGRKAFLVSRSARQKGHTPSKLYLELDSQIRDAIERQFSISPLSRGYRSFKDLLEVFDDLFVQWRYVFEGKCRPVNLSQLLASLQFLSEAIHAMPLRWA
jgi:hypothetical protein